MRPWRVGVTALSIVTLAAILWTAHQLAQPPQKIQRVEAVASATPPTPRYHAQWPHFPATTTTTEAPPVVELEPVQSPQARTTRTDPPRAETVSESSGEGENSTQASFYSTSEMGSSTASGIPLDDSAYTTAHRTLAFGTVLKVCHGGSCIQVTVTDRGPFIGGRDLDLSQAAFVALAGGTGAGVISVTWSVVG